MGVPLRRQLHPPVTAFLAVFLTGCSPVHLSDTHTTATPHADSFDAAVAVRDSVAILGLISPAGIQQGLSISLSHALAEALAEASTPIRGIANREIASMLNQKDLAVEYAELIAGFARSGILERRRLQRVGSAIGYRYVFLPGLAEFNEVVIDRLQISGWKFIQSRVTTLRLWLQLWDAEAGQIVWESTGEITLASELLRPERTVPINEVAKKLWLRMIQDNLLAKK
jgi:hypothetical protein